MPVQWISQSASCLYNGYLQTCDVSAQLFVSLDVYAIDVFDSINLGTIARKVQSSSRNMPDDNELGFCDETDRERERERKRERKREQPMHSESARENRALFAA